MHSCIQKERVKDDPFCAAFHARLDGFHDFRLSELEIGNSYAIPGAPCMKHVVQQSGHDLQVVCLFLWASVAYKYYALIHKPVISP